MVPVVPGIGVLVLQATGIGGSLCSGFRSVWDNDWLLEFDFLVESQYIGSVFSYGRSQYRYDGGETRVIFVSIEI